MAWDEIYIGTLKSLVQSMPVACWLRLQVGVDRRPTGPALLSTLLLVLGLLASHFRNSLMK